MKQGAKRVFYLHGRTAGSEEAYYGEERNTQDRREGHTPADKVRLPGVHVIVVTMGGVLNQSENHDPL